MQSFPDTCTCSDSVCSEGSALQCIFICKHSRDYIAYNVTSHKLCTIRIHSLFSNVFLPSCFVVNCLFYVLLAVRVVCDCTRYSLPVIVQLN